MPRSVLILNPLAGRGRAEGMLSEALEALQAIGVAPDIKRTHRHLHAIEIARQAMLDGYELVLAMGGDGTANEVANGMMSTYQGKPVGTLGILPVGSGNDFCKAIKWPSDLTQAGAKLDLGQRRLIDVGKLNERFFINGVGVGFDAVANIEAAKIRFLRGTPLYLLAVLRTLLLHYGAPLTRATIDGYELHKPILMASVTNGPCYGGGFWVTPDAQPDDGLFDVLIADHVNRLRILGLLPHFLQGTHTDKKPIYMTRGRHVILESADTLYAHIDGEIYSNNRLEFTLLPNALWVLN